MHADNGGPDDLSGGVIGCAFTVLNTRGLDGLETVYEDALVLEPDNPTEPHGGWRTWRAEGAFGNNLRRSMSMLARRTGSLQAAVVGAHDDARDGRDALAKARRGQRQLAATAPKVAFEENMFPIS